MREAAIHSTITALITSLVAAHFVLVGIYPLSMVLSGLTTRLGFRHFTSG